MEDKFMVFERKKVLIGLFILTLSFFACYFTTIKGLLNVWLTDGDYSYALLIPIITGYLIWERRKKILTTPIKTNWFGGLFVLFFLLASTYGILGSSPSAVRPAIPFIILSIALFCYGTAMFKVIVFPLSLIFLMIPLPTMVQTKIGVPLKRISTILGEWILRLFHVSVFVEGNVIDLGFTQLQVVDACSGLRYILPLLAIGILFAFFFEKSKWKRFVLVLSTIPLAILVNGIRIGSTGILAQYFGSKVAQGFFHGFSGWIVFMFAFAVLFLLHWILRLVFKGSQGNSIPSAKDELGGEGERSKNCTTPIFITSSLLFLVAILGYTTSALPNLAIKNGLSSFPLSINKWNGQAEFIDQDMVALSGAEESFSAIYRSNNGEIVSLYIGYRGSPFFENENFFHSPSICLPSSGWKILSFSTHVIDNMPQFGSITVRKMLAEKMQERCLVYFWFQTKSRTSYDININRWHLTLHALTRNNTHDLFIRLITPIGPDEKEEEVEARMDGFSRELTASIIQFLDSNQAEQH